MPTARQRGGNSKHQAKRKALLSYAYGTPCPRCGAPMLQGQRLDLGHSIDRVFTGSECGDRIEHALCNRRAGASMGNRLRGLRRTTSRW